MSIRENVGESLLVFEFKNNTLNGEQISNKIFVREEAE
jgi:hypothetical protein